MHRNSFLSIAAVVTGLISGCSSKVDTQDTQAPHTGTVELCLDNERVSDYLCVPCDDGSKNDAGDDPLGGDTECDPCDAGTFDAGGIECEQCEPGSFSADGATECVYCDAGTYELNNECIDCEEDFTSEEGAIECSLVGTDGYLGERDYGFIYWPENHWVNWGSYFDIQHIQTGFYGLSLDVSGATMDTLGLITQALPVEEAASQGNDVITSLPTAAINYAIIKDGTEHRGTEKFWNRDGNATNPSELVDMGRFMQRVRIPQVLYADSSDYSGSIELSALPRYFVLTHSVTRDTSASDLTISIEIEGDAVEQYTEMVFIEGSRAVSILDESGDGWYFIMPELDGVTAEISRFGDGGLAFEATFESAAAGEEMALSLTALPSNAATDEQIALLLNPEGSVSVQYAQLNRDGSDAEALNSASWDQKRGLFLIDLGDLTDIGAPTRPDWNDSSMHNWYNRHRFQIEHSLSDSVAVPIAFDGGRYAAFHITGGIPLIRDTSGEPIGAPVQISKNWHESPYWYHLYSTLELEPGTHEFEHTFAHAKWGETYAVQHSQLALLGYGYNQQWDESSLGAWGESITYDPDMTLSRATVDDVRPFLVDASGEWGWTGNVGGGSFLVYASSDGYESFPDHQLGRMRTHYAYTGPNLTNVLYAGVSRDEKIETRVSTQLGRTDDLVRAYYHLEYTFLEDVNYDRLALFQIAADRYGRNGFTQYAYGYGTDVIFDGEVPAHGTTGYASEADRGIPLTGDNPWVMLYDNSRSDGNLPENFANIGFVIRDYRAVIDGIEYETPYINIVQTNDGGYSQMAFELGLPYDGSSAVVPAGSVVTATLEYLVPPAVKEAYYGESDYLTAMSEADFQSTAMMQTLAQDNQLDLAASVGSVTRTYPIELEASAGITAVQFTLTGGLGYTPVTIHGLARPDGWVLEQEVNGLWEELPQAVEGNDYWQAYEDVSSDSFDLIFNIHNRGTNEYRLTRE